MENPTSWTPAHRAINEALAEHAQQIADMTCGLSLASVIVNKLRERGLLKETEST